MQGELPEGVEQIDIIECIHTVLVPILFNTSYTEYIQSTEYNVLIYFNMHAGNPAPHVSCTPLASFTDTVDR
ncbi:hypothetical protein EYC84_004726 [Monilinia fructicola]|uniref:Uncharacterized protein n=1 Tax=Monilinia fructicola TaxID=38448 RepID=A0A5M9K6C7_MONFR|nr:hypothetical protein EYC84_004726 [Monilinia fructicola]